MARTTHLLRVIAVALLAAALPARATAEEADDDPVPPPQRAPRRRSARRTPELKEPQKPVDRAAFPCDAGRVRAASVAWVGGLMNRSYHLVFSPTHLRNGCRSVRKEWRAKQRSGMRERPLRLPVLAVNGTGRRKRLPLERVGHGHLASRAVLRGYVDDDVWRASRWVFADVGASYFLRKRKPHFGSTFQMMCGYPGAERFRWYAFDDTDMSDAFPPFVRWRTALPSAATSSKPLGAADGKGTATGPTAVHLPQWLSDHTRDEDFVVVKLRVGPSEKAVVDGLLDSGAVSLIDELFLDCRDGGDDDDADEERTASETCRAWVRRLRQRGVFLHEW